MASLALMVRNHCEPGSSEVRMGHRRRPMELRPT